MTILVTGASGFVGSALCATLVQRSIAVRGAVRSLDRVVGREIEGVEWVAVGDIDTMTDWRMALQGVDCVIHCAARAHVMGDSSLSSLPLYRSLNVAGSQRLAEQAAEAGVRRLIYVSSIKVNGERTLRNRRKNARYTNGDGLPDHSSTKFTASDTPAPVDAYGISKWEAEQAIHAVAEQTGLEWVVVRPPLVYGPGVKGNLARLLTLIERGVPLPLATVDNRRSLVGLDNLIDLLIHCIDHPAAAGERLLVADGEDLSTADLLRKLATAMNRHPSLFPFPLSMLALAANVVGRGDEVARLVGSLEIDISETCRKLQWRPPISLDEGLRRMIVGSITTTHPTKPIS